MQGFDCGLCTTTHPSTEFDGATVKLPSGGEWRYSSYLGRQVGYCPTAADFTVRLADGVVVYTDKVDYNTTEYERDTIEWLEEEYKTIANKI